MQWHTPTDWQSWLSSLRCVPLQPPHLVVYLSLGPFMHRTSAFIPIIHLAAKPSQSDSHKTLHTLSMCIASKWHILKGTGLTCDCSTNTEQNLKWFNVQSTLFLNKSYVSNILLMCDIKKCWCYWHVICWQTCQCCHILVMSHLAMSQVSNVTHQ